MGSSNPFGFCGGRDHVQIGTSRRPFLQVGMIGGLGLSLGDFFRATAKADEGEIVMPGATHPAKEGPAKSVIHIFLPGGMAHQESFDPKPLAPVEYRGPLGTVNTSLTGEVFSEYMKETA